MNIVKSKEKNDCGICALACATGRPWHIVKAAIWAGRVERQIARFSTGRTDFLPEPNESCATSGRDLIDAASRLGFIAPDNRCKGCPIVKGTWDDLQMIIGQANKGGLVCFMIVKVQYQNVRASHWVVYDGHNIFDSNYEQPTLPRTFGYIPLSYVLFAPLNI